MDSLTQIALGSAVGVVVMGKRTPVWKAVVAGAVFGTLPDLDALIDHGDPIRNMTFHRAESHGVFYLTLLSPLLAWLVVKLWPGSGSFRRWLVAIWAILVTHVLLDTFTVYGTQLAQPFSDYPFAIGSIFIVDPLYTLPLLIGTAIALIRKSPQRWRANSVGLALSSGYLLWSMAAQFHVTGVAQDTLAQQPRPIERVLVTPTPLNTWVWRVLAMTPEGYLEGFYAMNDADKKIDFTFFPFDDVALQHAVGSEHPSLSVAAWEIERIAWFSHGFFYLREHNGKLLISDLRMGQEPYYSFNFTLAQRSGQDEWQSITPALNMLRPPTRETLQWLKQRATGHHIAPPRSSDTVLTLKAD